MNTISIIGSERSPFVRVCRMFMQKHQIPHTFEITNFVDDPKAAAEIAQKTPINRVPIMIFNGEQIFDSRVIINHLIKTYQLPALSIEDENRISTIYSCLDTGVILFLMNKEGYDMKRGGFFLSRHQQRIPTSLKYLEEWASHLTPSSWYYPEMSLFSFLYWAEKRELIRLSEYPVFEKFVQRFQNLPEVTNTTWH